MAATLHAFIRPRRGWGNEERAQFLRIQRLLENAGLAVEVEMGVTEEGDPWCVFCSRVTGDVIIHAARIDGRYMFDSSALARPIEGRSFMNCAERFFEDATLPMPLSERRNNGFMVHPSAMLASVFLTIILYAHATSEHALFEAEPVNADEGTESAAWRPLLKLKMIAQQVADYLASNEAQTPTAQAQQAQGWVNAVPAGMAVAVIAIAHDLEIGALLMEERDALAATAAGTEIHAIPPHMLDAAVVSEEARAEDGAQEGDAIATAPVEEGEAEKLSETETGTEIGAEPQLAEIELPALDAMIEQSLGFSISDVSFGADPEMVEAALTSFDTQTQFTPSEPTVSVEGPAAAMRLAGSFFYTDFTTSDALTIVDALVSGDFGTAASDVFGAPVSGLGDVGVGSGGVSAPVSGGSAGGSGAPVQAPGSVVVVVQPPAPAQPGPSNFGGVLPEHVLADLPEPMTQDSIIFSRVEMAAKIKQFVDAAGSVRVLQNEGDIVIVDSDLYADIGDAALHYESLAFSDDSTLSFIGLAEDFDTLLV